MSKRIKETISDNLQWCIVVLALVSVIFNTGITYNHLHGLTGTVGELKTDVDELKTSVDTLKVLVFRLVPDVKELERVKYGKEKS